MWTVRLFRADQLPADFHEPFIKSGYRACETSLAECLRSALHRTNETFNFWTHFLPFVYFLWRIWHLGSYYLDFVNDSLTWPLIGQLISICLYLLSSSIAHLFSCLSERARHVCFFLDYSSIGMYAVGCCISFKFYSFPQHLINTTYFDLYVPIVVVSAILMSTCGACGSRFMDESLIRHLCRLSSFMFPFIICNIPIFYRVTVCPDDECEAPSTTLHRWLYVSAFFTALIFATHFPERLSPGRFDVFCHSHQLFHVAAAISSNLHVNAVLYDMNDRRTVMESVVGVPTFWNSIGLFAIVLSIKALLVLCFSIMIYSRPEPDHVYRRIGKRQLVENYKHRLHLPSANLKRE